MGLFLDTDNNNKLLSSAEVAKIFNVTRATVFYWVRDRKLPYFKLPSSTKKRKIVRFRLSDVEKILKRGFVAAKQESGDSLVQTFLTKVLNKD